MRSSAIKQISSLGCILPFDSKVSSPPKIIPIVFFSNKLGLDLRQALESQQFVTSNFDSVPEVLELVFVRRNYDGSELYYLVTYLTFEEINKLHKLIIEQKGGILL